MTDKNKKDPVGSIAISPDHHPTRKPEKKKEKQPLETSNGPSLTKKTPIFESKKKEEYWEPDGPERRKIPRKTSPFLIWIVVSTIIGIFGYTVGGFFVVPYLLQTSFPVALSEKMDRPVTVGNASFNPFTLQCSIDNAIIGPVLSDPEDKVDPLFSIDNLTLTISPASLFKKKLIANNVSLDHLFLHLVRTGDKSYNISNLVKTQEPQAKPDDTSAGGLPFPFLLTNISASNSRIIFDDLPAKKTHTIEDITLAFPTFFYDRSAKGKSKAPLLGTATLIQPKFSAVINGSPVALSGDTSVTDKGIEAQLRLQLDQIDIPNYLGYLPFHSAFDVEKGTASGQLELVFVSHSDSKQQLEIKAQGSLDGVILRDKSGTITELPATTVQGSFLPLGRRYTFSEIKVTKPVLQIKRKKNGTWVFPDIIQTSPDTGKNAKPIILSIDLLQITGGKIDFTDNHVSGGFSESLVDLNMTVKNIDSQSEKTSNYVLSGTTPEKSKIVCQGDLTLSPLHMEGLLVANQLAAPRFSPYLPFKKDLQLKSGLLPKIEARFSLTLPSTSTHIPEISFHSLSAELSDFKLIHKKQEWMKFSKAHVVADKFNPAEKILYLNRIEVNKPYIFSSWNSENISSWEKIRATPSSKDSKPWSFSLDETKINNGSVRIEDHSWKTPFIQTFNNVTGKITGLSNTKKNTGKVILSASQNNKWKLNVDGTISLSPFKASAKCDLSDYPLSSSTSLFSNWLTPPVTSGFLHARGNLTLPQFIFKGSLDVTDFQAGITNKPKVSWKIGSADNVIFSRSPRELIINTMKLEHPYLNWTITPKDTAFHGSIFIPLLTSNKSSEKQTHVAIKNIELISGTLDINDTRLTQPFRSSATVSGSINDIENVDGKMAKVTLRGSASSNDSITVLGYLGLLHKEFSCDVTTEIANQNISAVAPQLESLLGYKIKDGRFDFLARYQQKSKQVTGTHSIVLTDLAIGQPKGSKTGQLPLTIALLTDNKGVLKYDLPITGNINEKSYSYPKAIQRSIQNILLKSTVSPFALALTSFSDIKETPDHILFAAGESELRPEDKKTLKNLHTILSNRPGLKVHIKGYAAAQTDRDGLMEIKKRYIDKKQLALEQVRSTILSESYGKELIQPSPLPGQSTEPIPEKIILKVKDKELQTLAKDREKAILDYLTATLKLDSDRVTLDKSGTIIPAHALGRKGTRADFSLGVKNN